MMTYDEFKEAIDKGFIKGQTVMIVRKNGQIFDYVLPHEEIRPWEIAIEENVITVLQELEEKG
ncbi:Paratox [Streptococcus dysgalactiae subsp. equisimilis]|uniref:competence regulator inhibitor paratox n=1 Tax=Streptococcus dysgalactiae TaxID=1334 RepID=UPI0008071AEB|nr:Paratox [Streptococcus dysgalactiae]OBZ00624.1 Paratox [Streptococcus dysgalactiae subsp. equisimilis]